MLLIGVRKSRKGHIRHLAHEIFEQPKMSGIKFVLCLDDDVPLMPLGDAIWRFCNNADVKRDSFILPASSEELPSHIVIDGTRKTKELDNFQRDWPNVLVSERDTIQKIDTLWPDLGLGEFIPSPSLKFADQVYGSEAVAEQ